MSNPFQNIRAAAGDQDRSFNWYMNSVKKMAGELTDYNDVKKTDLGDLTSKIEPGNMYMFMYDPKLKETLPYYDTFPLCLPFDSAPGGFVGLNLHYLPPLQRAVLLGNLLDYTDKQLTEKSKIDVSWSLLKNFTKFPQAKPSIKRYLNNHVQSRFLKVEPQHWKAAIFLPTHNFVGANTRTVYQNSNKAMQ